MSSILDIKISGESLDLFNEEEQDFYLTKQIHDISDLETRDADFSKTISVPLTPRNQEILRSSMPILYRHTDAPIEFLPTEVLLKGVPVISDGYSLLRSQNKKARTIELSVVGGSARFFNQLKDEPISNLDFTELNLEWTLAGITDIINAGNNGNPRQPIQFARSQFYSNASRDLYEAQNGNELLTKLDSMELGESGFLMYFKTVLDKIFSGLNELTIDYGSLLSLTDFTDSGFYVPVPIIHDSFGAVEGSYSEVRLENYQAPQQELEANLPFPIVVDNTAGYWNIATNQFVFTESGFFTIRFDVVGTTERNPQQFYLYKNFALLPPAQVLIDSVLHYGSQGLEFELTIQSSVSVVAGDVVEMVLGGYPFGNVNDTTFITSASFVIEAQGVGRGRSVVVSEMLPDNITQKNFVKEIFKLFNILVTEKNQVVSFSLFEDIPNNEPLVIEFNNELETSFNGAFFTYGTTNHFKYEENEAVQRLDQNSQFTILDNTLPESVVKIQSRFSPTDISIGGGALQDNFATLCFPNYELEYQFISDNKVTVALGGLDFTFAERSDVQAGDFISIDHGGSIDRRRVLSMVNDFGGVVDVAWTAVQNAVDYATWRYIKNEVALQIGKVKFYAVPFSTISVWDGGTTTIFDSYADIEFDSLRFSTLQEKYYKLLTESMNRPFIVVGWVSFGILKYLSINGLQPIFIEELDAYFYMNKLEQWKFNGNARVELVKINY